MKLIVKFHNTKTLRIYHMITKYCCTSCTRSDIFQFGTKTLAKINIIPQYQSAAVTIDKFLTNKERLCQSIRARLNSIGKINAKTTTVAKQTLKRRHILRSRNN